jgi:hypothetical protein
MLVDVRCRICKKTFPLDIKDWSKEKVFEWANEGMWNCANGHHVELGPPIEYLEFLWDTLREGGSPTKEEFEESLKKISKEIYPMDEFYKLFEIDSFLGGYCTAYKKGDPDKKERIFEFIDGPEGVRYYYS